MQEPIPAFARAVRDALAARPSWHAEDRAGQRDAAVLLMLFERDGEPWLVFTKRSEQVRTHKGEISFPGGAIDPGETAVQAAIREANEELGVDPADVTVIGELSELPTFVTGYIVKPIVAVVPEAEAYAHSEAEIAEVLRVPVRVLLDVGREVEWEARGHRFLTHVFEVDGHTIWGATGRILRDFLDAVAPALGMERPHAVGPPGE